MKKIFLMFVILFSITVTASSLDIKCGSFGYYYRLKTFTLPKEKESSIGLMGSDNLFQQHTNYVWSKVYAKNIETCLVRDEGFTVVGKVPVADITGIESKPVGDYFNGRFLRQIFECFCKINPNILNKCTMYVSYEAINCDTKTMPSCDSKPGYTGNLICENGSVSEQVHSVPSK